MEVLEDMDRFILALDHRGLKEGVVDFDFLRFCAFCDSNLKHKV